MRAFNRLRLTYNLGDQRGMRLYLVKKKTVQRNHPDGEGEFSPSAVSTE